MSFIRGRYEIRIESRREEWGGGKKREGHTLFESLPRFRAFKVSDVLR